MRKIDLNLLRVFLALYDERNVTRAAYRLNLTQSATSNALSRLRAELNDPLFVRASEGLVPTAQAEAIAIPVRKSLEMINDALDAGVEFDPATARQRFRVCAPDHTLMMLLPSLLPSIRNSAPNVEFDWQPISESNLDKIRAGDVDLIISYLLGQKSENLRATRLLTENSVVVVSQNHPHIDDKLTFDDYLDADHVVLRPYGTWLSSPIDQRLREFGRERNVKMTVASHLTAVTVVRCSTLIASIPGNLARNLSEDSSLKFFPIPFEFAGFDVMLAWHERAHHDPAHRWLRRLISDFRDYV